MKKEQRFDDTRKTVKIITDPNEDKVTIEMDKATFNQLRVESILCITLFETRLKHSSIFKIWRFILNIKETNIDFELLGEFAQQEKR